MLFRSLRYGENPHQSAALYGKFREFFQQLHGKELSYNNILDLTAAAGLIAEFESDSPTLAILKHTNPCGIGQGTNLREAWEKAFATDKQAPFGGIIVVNETLDGDCAAAIAEIFSEVIIAPDFSSEALEILQKKKNLRLIQVLKSPRGNTLFDLRSVGADSFLLQQSDLKTAARGDLRIVTKRQPTEDEFRAMLFGWRVAKHVKSNAIVFAKDGATIGIGAGQPSRVDSSKIAVAKAANMQQAAGLAQSPVKGAVMASDAFFPFADGLEVGIDAGITAVIQPGGSRRDKEVIAAADKAGIAMVFTGLRHFRH